MSRSKILPSMMASLALFGLATVAHAETADGNIAGIDHTKMTVTLDNGKVYHVSRSGALNGVETGMHATVHYEMKDGKMVVTEITTED